MKTIIAGSRTIQDYAVVDAAVRESGFVITEVVSGGANGVDALGERYARENGIPLRVLKADWNAYGKAAGPRRNIQMAEYAEALIAVTTGSKGTAHMILEATRRGLRVHVLGVGPVVR